MTSLGVDISQRGKQKKIGGKEKNKERERKCDLLRLVEHRARGERKRLKMDLNALNRVIQNPRYVNELNRIDNDISTKGESRLPGQLLELLNHISKWKFIKTQRHHSNFAELNDTHVSRSFEAELKYIAASQYNSLS
ncbi:hypothetical protein YC2023_022582 [Brassica napus]